MGLQTVDIEQILVQENNVFPNSSYPALLYKSVLDIPLLFPATNVKHLFEKNGWSNSWHAGIYEFHHYHSITHEVLGIYQGKTKVQLGGPNGRVLFIEKGDVLVIPAGVAHKNLGAENSVGVVGAYPEGREYDMNYGKPGERPGTDRNIKTVPIPASDPLYGKDKGLIKIWK